MPGVLVIHYQLLYVLGYHMQNRLLLMLKLSLCLHQFSVFANIKDHAQQLIV